MPFQKLSEASRTERGKAGQLLPDFVVKRILDAEDLTYFTVMGKHLFYDCHIHGGRIGYTGGPPVR